MKCLGYVFCRVCSYWLRNSTTHKAVAGELLLLHGKNFITCVMRSAYGSHNIGNLDQTINVIVSAYKQIYSLMISNSPYGMWNGVCIGQLYLLQIPTSAPRRWCDDVNKHVDERQSITLVLLQTSEQTQIISIN